MSETHALLLEVGTEEIPARMAAAGVQALSEILQRELALLHLAPHGVTTLVTPRRLVVSIDAIAARQEDRDEEILGPPAAIAWKDGKPTKAAEGFARGKRVDTADLFVKETPKGPYVAVIKHHKGERTHDILQELLPRAIASIPWPKSMRWSSLTETFVRPLHWIVALFGGEVVRFEYAGVTSGSRTRGHRFLGREEREVSGLADYLAAMEAGGVIPDPAERRRRIEARVVELEAEIGGRATSDPGLLDEIAHLVEYPVGSYGTFSEEYLALPPEVLIAAMRNHQRYLAVHRPGSEALSNHFIVFSNTAARDQAVVTRGNQRVLAARLSDARFFWTEDLRHPLEHYVSGLADRIFLAGLGTVKDKADRIAELAGALARRLSPDSEATAVRAALLCKADLGTHMVGEFPELQGVMGAYYASAANEPEGVATAIREHYQPRFAGDATPSTDAGAIVALADKLDSLAGCFGIGLVPTGNQDPYALRRGVLGAIHILLHRGWQVPFEELLDLAIGAYGDRLQRPRGEVAQAALDFFRGRVRNWLVAEHPADIVEAVLATGHSAVPDIVRRTAALDEVRQLEDWVPLAVAFKRVANITKELAEAPVAFGIQDFTHEAELALAQEAERRGGQAEALVAARDFEAALRILVGLKPSVDRFFDAVLVNDPDETVRNRRLALLVKIRNLFTDIADFTRIQT
jgi:glycyl-tRNA synthetase beta chain